jgi:deoxyribose-phosphate aldolase
MRPDIAAALGVSGLRVGAVCVYHEMVPEAVRCVGRCGLPVAAVSTGFPAGLSAFETRVREIELSVAAGAREIDIVIGRRHALLHDWRALYDEVRAFRRACGDAHMKTILATGDLQTLENVARASWVCMMAGADFIKTSTGKESVNATLDVSLVMVRAIRDYHDATGFRIGFKPAGGISSARAATQYLTLMREELGAEWVRPELFRIGASSLLSDIERQLEHHLSGAYSAAWRHPLP